MFLQQAVSTDFPTMISKNNKQQKIITDSITQLPIEKHTSQVYHLTTLASTTTTPLNHLSQLANKILYAESKRQHRIITLLLSLFSLRNNHSRNNETWHQEFWVTEVVKSHFSKDVPNNIIHCIYGHNFRTTRNEWQLRKTAHTEMTGGSSTYTSTIWSCFLWPWNMVCHSKGEKQTRSNRMKEELHNDDLWNLY